jgi:hypothetical protein
MRRQDNRVIQLQAASTLHKINAYFIDCITIIRYKNSTHTGD